MTTDTKWTWTILMREGGLWQLDESVTIHELLELFYAQGYQETQIEAIIRH